MYQKSAHLWLLIMRSDSMSCSCCHSCSMLFILKSAERHWESHMSHLSACHVWAKVSPRIWEVRRGQGPRWLIFLTKEDCQNQTAFKVLLCSSICRDSSSTQASKASVDVSFTHFLERSKDAVSTCFDLFGPGPLKQSGVAMLPWFASSLQLFTDCCSKPKNLRWAGCSFIHPSVLGAKLVGAFNPLGQTSYHILPLSKNGKNQFNPPTGSLVDILDTTPLFLWLNDEIPLSPLLNSYKPGSFRISIRFWPKFESGPHSASTGIFCCSGQ